MSASEWPFHADTCDGAVRAASCEQHPLPDGAAVHFTLAAGSALGAIDETLAPPSDGFNVASVVGGGDAAAASKNLEDVTLDPSRDLVLSWAPAAGTAGGDTDAVLLQIVTSNEDRVNYEPKIPFGVATCLVPASAAGASITLSKAGIATLHGTPTQRGGTAKITLARLRTRALIHDGAPTTTLRTGRGVFGYALVP